MIRIARIATLLALVAAPLAALPALAQDSAAQWLVATGRTQTTDGKWIESKLDAESRRALVQEIGAELAQAEVSRDWAPAAAKLEAWGALATWSGTLDRESLLEHIALRKVELYERFGRTREALAAVEGVLVRADGKELWATARFARKVQVIDLGSKTLKLSIPVGSSPHGVFFLNHAGLR